MKLVQKPWAAQGQPKLTLKLAQKTRTAKGAYYGWSAAKVMLEKYFANRKEITRHFGPRKVRRCGDMASIVYEWRTDGRSALDGTRLFREGYGTDVFLRQGGEWKLYHNHVSLARPGTARMLGRPW